VARVSKPKKNRNGVQGREKIKFQKENRDQGKKETGKGAGRK
jgi:hypothetical protein